MPPRDRPARPNAPPITARRAPKKVVRRRRGRGEGFDLAGNTRIDIELKINGQLDKKISAINTEIRGGQMTFRILNSNATFRHPRNQNYIEAFRRLFVRLQNASS